MSARGNFTLPFQNLRFINIMTNSCQPYFGFRMSYRYNMFIYTGKAYLFHQVPFNSHRPVDQQDWHFHESKLFLFRATIMTP